MYYVLHNLYIYIYNKLSNLIVHNNYSIQRSKK